MNWKQLTGPIELRFRLIKNQIVKGGTFNTAFLTVAFILLIFMSVVSFLGTVIGGALLLGPLRAEWIVLTWNVATLVFIGSSIFELMNSVQQNDAIEIDRLLHLPLTMGGAFSLNYLSSLASLNMLMLAPIVIGLAIAMPIAKGWHCFIAIPLSVSFLFMVTALMFQLRGWFAGLAKNKRTKGWLMIVVPFALVALILAMTEFAKSSPIQTVISENPLGFMTLGIDAANRNANLLPGLIGTACMTTIGVLSLFLAYRKSMKQYTGADIATRSNTRKVLAATWEQSSQFNKLPWTSKPESAVALAELKCLRRAPEILAAVIPLIAAIIFGSPYLIGIEGYNVSPFFKTQLPVAVIFLTLIGFPAFLFSTYSYDRDGFRAFMLSPLPRETILHGKNLAVGIPTVICGWVSLLVLQIFLPVGPIWFLASLIQVPAAFLLMCFAGHIVSIFTPIGFKRGSMQPVNLKLVPAIAIYVGVLVGPMLAVLPASFAQELSRFAGFYFGASFAWLYVLISVIQLAVTWVIYRKSLPMIASWLWNREPEILEMVANIPE